MTPERRRALEMGARLLGPGINEARVALAAENLRDNINEILWKGRMQRQEQQEQHVVVHRTFANGMQMGYGREDHGYRMFSRPDTEAPWSELGHWDRSWVTLADRISNLPEWDDDAAE